MTPLKLTITGSIGIRAGLGRETLTMDLTQLIPDDALTVALKGDNGCGKSTVLNLALTPWREPPMLSGTLYEEFGDTGLRELEFSHGSHRFKSRIEIRQTAKTKTQRAYLHVEAEDIGDWKPVVTDSNSVSDGKARTYDECLEYILGPQSLYYLSAFRSQGAPKLAEYDDPKGLMRDLLDLEEPAKLKDKSKSVAKEIRQEYGKIQYEFERLDGYEQDLAALELKIDAMTPEVPELLSAKTAAAEYAARARADFESITQAENENTKIREQRDAIGQRITQLRESQRDGVAAAESDLQQAKRRLHQVGVNTEETQQQINRRIENAQRILQGRSEIEQAAGEADKLVKQIPGHESTVSKLRDKALELADLTAELKALIEKQSGCRRAGQEARVRLDELTDRAGYIEKVPCGGVAPYDTCPALKNAILAKESLPAAEDKVDTLRGDWETMNRQAKALAEAINDLDCDRNSVAQAEQVLANVRRKLDGLRRTAALSETLKQAEQIADEASMELQSEQMNSGERREELEAEILDLTKRVDDLRNNGPMSDAIRDAQAELEALPDPDPAQRLIGAREDLEEAESLQSQASRAVDQKNADIAEGRAQAGTLRNKIESGTEVRKRADYLSGELARWELLSLALQGVIDLSIEDAGPAVSGTANSLLTEAYGPRFSTQIVTQRTQANGRVVECFDISVIDADTGMESSILKKSGGESVWLDKALTDAVGIYHQDAAGTHYECLFADESEDGLTQDRKSRFYRMDRAALEMGGYRRKYFVSHHPEAWSMADAVIDLESFRSV